MGCASSIAADTKDGRVSDDRTSVGRSSRTDSRRSTVAGMSMRSFSRSIGEMSRSSGSSRNTTSSLEDSGDRKSRRLSGAQSIFRRFSASRSSNTSSVGGDRDWERNATAADPLGLGKESNVAKAPSQWIAIMGPRGSGKSTLIRQLKLAHDGADVAESKRFTREVHKLAIDCVKQVAKEVATTVSDADARAAADRLQTLGRRAQVNADIAADVRTLWACPEVAHLDEEPLTAVDAHPADVVVQRRKARRHYVERIEELAKGDYVPEPLDLLHMAIPTVGQQETRVAAFPGGDLSLFELNVEVSRSSTITINGGVDAKNQPQQDLFGYGLRGIIFVASLLEYESSDDGSVALPKDVLKMWRNAQCIAASSSVPCFLLLSKEDLVSDMSASGGLSRGLSASALSASVRAQLLAHKQTENASPTRASAASLPPGVGGASPDRTLALDVLDFENGVNPFIERMMQQAFPELESEDDDKFSALGGSVHVCLSFFCTEDGAALSKGGTLPVALWQSHALGFADHVWLHQLPQPLPNPQLVTGAAAERLGKDSPNETHALFWRAIYSLSEQIGCDIKTLGTLHISPLLTSTGALLVVFRQELSATMHSLGKGLRGLRWRPVAQVAARLSKVAQAAELRSYRQEGADYAQDLKEMLNDTPSVELHPVNWLDKLKLACKHDHQKLMPGTYMAAFYTRSTRDGFQILMPHSEHPSMLPHVKISDGHFSASDWAAVCEIEAATVSGKEAANIPKNWAAAKSWMGPEVGAEKQFSMVQKFFYGIVSLRQRLERKCTAIRDDLRYSSIGGAQESLAALGELYTGGIVPIDPDGRVQLLIVTQHFDLASTEQLPKALRWTPISIFEARHFGRFVPQVRDAVSNGKHVILKALDAQQTMGGQNRDLRGSNASSQAGSDVLHDSGMRSSSLSAAPDHEKTSAVNGGLRLLTKAVATETVFSKEDEEGLESAWMNLRWTKEIVQATCAKDTRERVMGGDVDSKAPPKRPTDKKATPKQRMDHHAKLYKETLKGVEGNVKQLRKKAEQLESLVGGRDAAAAPGA